MLIRIYVTMAIVFIYSMLKTRRALHMLQQNLYNENNRYLKWVWKNKKEMFTNIDIYGIIFVSLFALCVDTLISYYFLALIIILYGYCLLKEKKKKKEKDKKPLVYTARIKRLIATLILLHLIVCALGITVQFILVDTKIDFPRLCDSIIILSVMAVLNYYVVYIAYLINKPIEYFVYRHFEKKAKRKLASMENLKVVGITGSYGKTSTKNFLNEILSEKYNVLATPKSLNTFNGLMITVNNSLSKFDEVFIAEMGAYVKGEINGLCKLVNPKYGIITKIGTAHLETFGSEENIQSGKMELIEYLPEDGVGVLNRDDEKQKNYKFKNKNHCKLLWVGIDTKDDVDVRASKIRVNHEGTTFTVEFKGDKKKYEFKTRLLGKHNVYNIISCLALGYELGINVEHLQRAVGRLKPIEHRLSMKNFPKFVFIDDAYNSNPEGSKRALEVLNMMDGYKVVVTPGMIELGDKEEYYNKEFGKGIAEVADHVILVGEKQTKPILEGLKEKGFKESDIEIINDVTKAYMILNSMKTKKKIYALFENDLPDTYNEK